MLRFMVLIFCILALCLWAQAQIVDLEKGPDGSIIRVVARHIPESLSFDQIQPYLHLRSLSLIGDDCDVAGMNCWNPKKVPAFILELKELESLSLILFDLRQFPLELAQLPGLKSLDLTHNYQLSLAGIEAFTQLESLSLNDCGLQDEDLLHLYPLKNLRSIGLSDNQFSSEALQNLRHALPQTEIFAD